MLNGEQVESRLIFHRYVSLIKFCSVYLLLLDDSIRLLQIYGNSVSIQAMILAGGEKSICPLLPTSICDAQIIMAAMIFQLNMLYKSVCKDVD